MSTEKRRPSRLFSLLSVVMLPAVVAIGGCAQEPGPAGTGGSGGGGGTDAAVTGGSGGATGGSGGSTGGSGGATGGTGGATGGTGGSFWPNAFSSCPAPVTRTPTHWAGRNCLDCHRAGGTSSRVFLFAGTVYPRNATVPLANVEVGVRSGTTFYSACVASNGNFWLQSTAAFDWANAETRVRNANGESSMLGAVTGGCNAVSCHDSARRILVP